MQECDDQGSLQPVTLQVRLNRMTPSIANKGTNRDLRRTRGRNLVFKFDGRPREVSLHTFRDSSANRDQHLSPRICNDRLDLALRFLLQPGNSSAHVCVELLYRREETVKDRAATAA